MFNIMNFDRLIEQKQERSDEGELQIAGETITADLVPLIWKQFH